MKPIENVKSDVFVNVTERINKMDLNIHDSITCMIAISTNENNCKLYCACKCHNTEI